MRLASESLRIHCLGNAVQRHIDKSGDPASGSGPCGGPESLPFRSTRFVDVNVRVHQARKQQVVAEVVQVDGGRDLFPVADLGDLLAFHDQGCGPESLGGQNAS